MQEIEEIVIVAGRTYAGWKISGSALRSFRHADSEPLWCAKPSGARTSSRTQIDECIMGNVVSAGLGQNPARQAALYGGLPPEVSALTINKVCGSGLKAVALAAQAIQTGNAEIVVAGGMESMTNAPYLLPQAPQRLPHGQRRRGRLAWCNDGLWDVLQRLPHGRYRRERRREVRHHARGAGRVRAQLASQSCRRVARRPLRSQVVPVEIPAKKKGQPPILFERDESIREDASIEALRALKPAFKKDGTVTAGNAPGVNDAAAAVVIMSATKARPSA